LGKIALTLQKLRAALRAMNSTLSRCFSLFAVVVVAVAASVFAGGCADRTSVSVVGDGPPGVGSLENAAHKREAVIQAAFETHPEWSEQVKHYIREGYGAEGMTIYQMRLAFYEFEWTRVSYDSNEQGDIVESWEIYSPPPNEERLWATLFFKNDRLTSYREVGR
jgi:hypothetical protein